MITPHAQPTPTPRGPELLVAEEADFVYLQKTTPETSALQWLTCGFYGLLPGAASEPLCHPHHEALLFALGSGVVVEIDGQAYQTETYDVLYVPKGAQCVLDNLADEAVEFVVCRAPATTAHPPYHARWEDIRANEDRIRHLDGKDVFLMFDVSEGADKLMAGFTVYEPYTRAWPPHNHTDQEEVYVFTQGVGAMEVYRDEQTKTFVTGVQPRDVVTIPPLYYHPVFSQSEELHFIWCIAGERYWVGDKDQRFMDASSDAVTT